MMHIPLRKLLIGGWLGMLAVILAGTVALGASPITTSFYSRSAWRWVW